MHSPMFEKIKLFYDKKLWNDYMVAEAVMKGLITEEEYEEITGKPFEPVEAEATIQDYENGMRELGVKQ